MNNVTLIGRLVRDPELRYLNSNNAVCKFTLAVDKQLSRDKKAELESKNQPTADFINCQAWGKIAETIPKFTEKGNRVGLTGRIATGSYAKDDGTTVYTTDVIVNNIEFLDWKESNSNNKGQTNKGFTNSNNPNDFAPKQDEFNFGDDFDFNSDNDKVPF